MTGNNNKARLGFLNYKPDSPSIMETFEVSRTRLTKPDCQARALMNFISMIETEGKEELDFRDFFFERAIPFSPEDFPDHELLSGEDYELQVLFSELEKVSFGERLQISDPFNFHPLWLECNRQSMGNEGRIRYARQVLLICYRTIVDEHSHLSGSAEVQAKFLPHGKKCLHICRQFAIKLEDLELPAEVAEFSAVDGGHE